MKRLFLFLPLFIFASAMLFTASCDTPVEYDPVDESYVAELYGNICETVPFDGGSEVEYSLYTGKKVTAADITEDNMKLFVWKAYIHGFEGLESYASGDYSGIGYELIYHDYPADLFNERIKSLFGSDAIVANETFWFSGYIAKYDEKEQVYHCTDNAIWTEKSGVLWNKMTDYSQEGEYLYIYDKMLYFYYVNGDNLVDMMYDFGKIDIAAYGCTSTEGQQTITPELHFNDFYTFYEDDAPLLQYGADYKHTFKRAEDGTYYWVSSEPYNAPEDKNE